MAKWTSTRGCRAYSEEGKAPAGKICEDLRITLQVVAKPAGSHSSREHDGILTNTGQFY